MICFLLKKLTRFDAGKEAVQKLSVIMTYAMIISVFFVGLEIFTAFYSQIPGHMASIKYLFVGIDGHGKLVPFMWLFALLAIVALAILINPKTRENERTLLIGCAAVFVSMWLEKGLGLVVAGFIPNMFEVVREYVPTPPEILIVLAVWATGCLVLTLLYKVAVTVKEEKMG